MGRTIAAAAVVFAMAATALQHADLIGRFGEPVLLLLMGTLFIFLSKLVNRDPGAAGTVRTATVLTRPGAITA